MSNNLFNLESKNSAHITLLLILSYYIVIQNDKLQTWMGANTVQFFPRTLQGSRHGSGGRSGSSTREILIARHAHRHVRGRRGRSHPAVVKVTLRQRLAEFLSQRRGATAMVARTRGTRPHGHVSAKTRGPPVSGRRAAARI